MRKRAATQTTSEETISLSQLTKLVLELSKRVTRLEKDASGYGPFILPNFGTHPDKSSMGRKPKLAMQEVVKRRDGLALWIETNWRYLSQELSKALNPKSAAHALAQAKESGAVVMHFVPFYSDPARFADEVWAFLKSKRYRGNPRNLAGAMAGLPELSWKRSLDIAQKNPVTTPMQPQAWRDHLRRRFPDRFRELRRAQTVEEVRAILRKSKSDDVTYCHMKKHPQEVFDRIVKPGIKGP